MYKLIIVDDELYVIEGLKLMIDFERYGYCIAGEAKNAAEALELCKSHLPDVIITDLKMPGLSGIELIKSVYEINNHIRFIILTGHGEFAHAREAMKYNVRHFLLKPIDSEEMDIALSEIKDELTLDEIEKSLIDDKFKKSLFVKKMIYEMNAGDEIPFSFMEDNTKSYAALLCQTDCHVADKNKVFDFLSEIDCIYALEMNANIISGVLFVKNDLRSEARELFGKLKNYMASDIKAVVGCEVFNPFDIKNSIKILSDISMNISAESNSCIFCDDIQQIAGSPEINIEAIADNVTERIEFLDFDGIINILDSINNEFGFANQRFIQLFHPYLIFKVTMLISDLGGEPAEFFKEQHFSSERDFEGLISNVLTMCSLAIDYLKQLKKSNIETPIEKVMEYLTEHFKEDIVIKELAKEFYYSPVYLGNAFLKRYGISIKEYIHKTRIEEARRLIRENKKTTNEISLAVGYNDYNNFFSYFKKYTGQSPNEFKKSMC